MIRKLHTAYHLKIYIVDGTDPSRIRSSHYIHFLNIIGGIIHGKKQIHAPEKGKNNLGVIEHKHQCCRAVPQAKYQPADILPVERKIRRRYSTLSEFYRLWEMRNK